jgi:dienelactone hydrolase
MNKVIWHADAAMSREVLVSSNQHLLSGELKVPQNASGIVLFAHGSGSSRHSPRNRYVARRIRDAGVATLLFDLLTPQEEEMDLRTREFRFNINLLARRLADATRWVNERADRIADKSHVRHLRVGYFGASTGARLRSSRRRSLARE